MSPDQLRLLIERTGLTQAKFAAKLKVHYVTVSRWVMGRTPVSAANAALIRERFPS